MKRPLAVTTTRTVISFFVSVPVLSEAITLAEPSVSTAARWRTIALRRAMRCTPIESTAVTTAGSPSGTAATASATPRISTSKMAEAPRTSSTTMIVTIITTAMATTTMPRSLPVRSSSRCSGVALVVRLFQESGDAAHLGAHPGRGHDRLAVPVGRRRAAEDHVVPIAERDVVGDRCGVLGDRQALTGQRGLGRLQRGRFDQPRIGGNGVAFLDENDVAGDDLGGRRCCVARRRG